MKSVQSVPTIALKTAPKIVQKFAPKIASKITPKIAPKIALKLTQNISPEIFPYSPKSKIHVGNLACDHSVPFFWTP